VPVPGGDRLSAVYTEWAGFADVTYHFLPQFDVEAGARWSTNKQHANTHNRSGLLTTGGGPDTDSPFASNGDDFTYSVAPRWHVNKDTLIYGRVATGYRPGGPNDVPANAPAAVPRAYGSDETFNYELGLRTSLLDHKLSLDVAAFHIDWSNIQLYELLIINNTPFGINGNGGDARSQGVEWTIGLFPVKGLSLNWTGAYTDAVMTKISAPGGIAGIMANTGDRLPFVPAWQTALDGQYQWPVFGDYRAFVGGTLAYTGERYSSFAAFGSPNVTHARLPSYDTLALRAGLENDRWRLELYGKNLGDTRGITDYSSQGAPNFAGSINIIQPRTIGAVLAAKF
jgi:iron complex outermembrane recepter protein